MHELEDINENDELEEIDNDDDPDGFSTYIESQANNNTD